MLDTDITVVESLVLYDRMVAAIDGKTIIAVLLGNVSERSMLHPGQTEAILDIVCPSVSQERGTLSGRFGTKPIIVVRRNVVGESRIISDTPKPASPLSVAELRLSVFLRLSTSTRSHPLHCPSKPPARHGDCPSRQGARLPGIPARPITQACPLPGQRDTGRCLRITRYCMSIKV